MFLSSAYMCCVCVFPVGVPLGLPRGILCAQPLPGASRNANRRDTDMFACWSAGGKHWWLLMGVWRERERERLCVRTSVYYSYKHSCLSVVALRYNGMGLGQPGMFISWLYLLSGPAMAGRCVNKLLGMEWTCCNELDANGLLVIAIVVRGLASGQHCANSSHHYTVRRACMHAFILWIKWGKGEPEDFNREVWSSFHMKTDGQGLQLHGHVSKYGTCTARYYSVSVMSFCGTHEGQMM